jgi:hypothetical protein
MTGCESAAEITEYTAPRDKDAGRPFSCRVPSDWTLGANDRFSSLAFESKTGARITVSSLKGSGDEFLLININRWRRQVGLDPIEKLDGLGEAELKKGEAKFVKLAGEAKALEGAMVEYGGKTWFFKMSGTVASVADQSDEFSDFLKSVEFFERS